ncbi:hypothetical protein [Marinobacter zhejiangensis]|uniref:Uncharacterized protein n=1 Tax=Marinobacter zhejiangensis TaxID=488535 RepID=A0A1I4NHQ7_9GAMM|nr:hypothetical protein [Marinobacter zhejiangensis]SFM15038.1 hypothetical protein SAMN04487963_1410 [Marinobacter zhejiangensis]
MASRVDQVVMMALTNIERDGVIDINEFLSAQLQHGRDVWCRIPDQLQAYLCTVSLGMRGEELGTEYFSLSTDYRYLSIGDKVIREMLAVGQSVVSVTELFASIDEHLEFITLSPAFAAFETCMKERSANQSFIDTLRMSSRRAMRTQERFVIGLSKGGNIGGSVSSQVMEQSFPVKLSDLFALKADYQNYLSEAQGHEATCFMEEWMTEDLRVLNRYAATFNKKYGQPGKLDVDDEALEKLRTDLASDLKAKNPGGPKVTAAIKIVVSTRVYYPKTPIKPISGEKKVSLLDIANALAKLYWKGTVEETQRDYKTNVEKFEQKVMKVLDDHKVLKYAALSRELSRFIRFRT